MCLNNKLIKKSVIDNNLQKDITTVINVGNNEVVEIFGINNENLKDLNFYFNYYVFNL